MRETEITKALDRIKSDTTSNDPIDVLGGELEVAAIIKRYAEKRFEAAKDEVIKEYSADIELTKAKATKLEMKCEKMWHGKEKTLLVSCNAPASRLDANAFYNELIKAGVKKEIVDKAKAAATKQNAPATSYSAVSV